MAFKRWIFSQLDKDKAAELAEQCSIDPFLALLLTNRQIDDFDGVEQYLLCNELMDDPFAFADMDVAVARIQRAIDTGENIAVYGDYDADGVTATVLLYTYLRSQNANACYYIPKREGEGYGLHCASIDLLAQQGVQLLITVDNGISAVDQVAYANTLGIDVIVTDHHQPQQTLPPAVAVVNPHRPDCGSQFKDYAGVGVVFKLICALDGDPDAMLEQYADLVAIGTLADVMPIVSENRALVRQGLGVINQGGRLGLSALLQAAGVNGESVNALSTLFSIAPRLNAAGRMGNPDLAAKLLLCQDEANAPELAQQINQLNIQRQQIEIGILQQVCAQLEEQPSIRYDRVMVLFGQDWHPGVVGIIAARMVDRFGKPCIILTNTEEEGMAKGSGRSVPGFSLFDALTSCADLLTNFGGHELAAGMGLAIEDIGLFRQRINAYAAERHPQMPVLPLHIDCKLRPSQIDLDKLQLIAMLEPFGNGNPAPVFALCRMRLENILPVGQNKHLRLSLSRDGVRLNAMKFHTTPKQFPIPCGAVVDVAVTLEPNEYKGVMSVSILVKDIRYSHTNQDDLIAGQQLYEAIMRGEYPDGWQEAIPVREQLASVYRLLKSCKGWNGSTEQLFHALGGQIPFPALLVSVEVLRQADLIQLQDYGDVWNISMVTLPEGRKADLNQTPLMQQISCALRERVS